jgi:hypothetical protein
VANNTVRRHDLDRLVAAGRVPAGVLPAGKGRRAKAAQLVAPAVAIEVTVPYRVVNESNRPGRCWRDRSRRAKQAREAWAAMLLWAGLALTLPNLPTPLAVTLTRIGGRRMDDDGVAAGCKSLRDAVAQTLGMDDGDPRVTWCYSQRPGPGPVGVEVRISTGGAGACPRS